MATIEKHPRVPALNIASIREEFPILHQQVHKRPLVYFDNAATTQKPRRVIQALKDYYELDNANIHRGIHSLAERATEAFEKSRKEVASFINAKEAAEIVFTKGTTDSINLVASSYGKAFFKPGDEILISGMEHHSNIVPWQLIAEQSGAVLKVIPVLANGELDLETFYKLLSEKTAFLSIVYVSNSLGTVNPVKEMIAKAHGFGVPVLLDAAQATAHLSVDVQGLGCDFMAFSGHKMYGPTGVGVLYGKRSFLEKMPPYQGGGEMIKEVRFEKTTYNDIPHKFEAGTPNIADVIALKESIRFIQDLGKEQMANHEDALLQYAKEEMENISGIRFVGEAKDKISVLSFLLEGVHPYDVGLLLDAKGIAVRTGHHCTQPLMDHFKIEGTIRASFAVYNTKEEIDRLVEGIQQVQKTLS